MSWKPQASKIEVTAAETCAPTSVSICSVSASMPSTASKMVWVACSVEPTIAVSSSVAAGRCSELMSSGRSSAISARATRSEEHTSELQSLMRISYAVFCLKKKNNTIQESSTSYHATIIQDT